MAQIAQLSPGVITTETNLTTVVPSVLTTAGAMQEPLTGVQAN